MTSRLLALLVVAATAGACGDAKRGSPFAQRVTSELRETFATVCAHPKYGSDVEAELLNPSGTFASAQSSGSGCTVRIDYDPRDGTIKYLVVTSGYDWDWFPMFMQQTVLPLVKPPIRAWLEKNVLDDLRNDKKVEYSVRGKGEVSYHNRPHDSVDADLRPIKRPSVVLAIGWK